MGRAPCCEKMGLKKGPWSHDEDQILISYIQQHGHGNWRALPKLAGLLRCGKSCRLRWTNYLRPDIKRGNFTKEEEDTIINLHQMLGNRWSAIAAKLPGRTDNEIKNVWHTHLKKKLPSGYTTNQVSKKRNMSATKSESGSKDQSSQLHEEQAITESSIQPETSSLEQDQPVSPQHSSSELSSVTEATTDSSVVVKHEKMDIDSSVVAKDEEIGISLVTEATTDSSPVVKHERMDYPSNSLLDDSFWSEALSGKENNLTDGLELEFPLPPFTSMENEDVRNNLNPNDEMDFWYNIFTGAEELPELPEF